MEAAIDRAEGTRAEQAVGGVGLAADDILDHRHDRQQDHRLMAELTWNSCRDHLILEYEIPEDEGDHGSPNVFFALDEATDHRKVGR